MLASGCTIHKAQGQTLEAGVLDCGDNEGKHPGRTYTGASRFKDPAFMYFQPPPTFNRLLWANNPAAQKKLKLRLGHEDQLEHNAYLTLKAHFENAKRQLAGCEQTFTDTNGDTISLESVDPTRRLTSKCG